MVAISPRNGLVTVLEEKVLSSAYLISKRMNGSALTTWTSPGDLPVSTVPIPKTTNLPRAKMPR